MWQSHTKQSQYSEIVNRRITVEPKGRETRECFKKLVALNLSIEGWGVYQTEMENMNKNRERERVLLKRQCAGARSWNVITTDSIKSLDFIICRRWGKQQRFLSMERPWLDWLVRKITLAANRKNRPKKGSFGFTFLLLCLDPSLTLQCHHQ